MFATLRSRIRGLILGPKARQLGRRTKRPPLGAAIVCKDLRMMVQAGMSEELWAWLMEQGWREPGYQPDRRQYRDIPASIVTTLVDAHAEERAAVLAEAVAQAVRRPQLRKPRTAAAKGAVKGANKPADKGKRR